MSELVFPVKTSDRACLDQLSYALNFASGEIEDWRLTDAGELVVTVGAGGDADRVRASVEELIERYTNPKLGMKSEILFEQQRTLEKTDVWGNLVDRGWVHEVGQGHVILRGRAAQVFRFVDHEVLRRVARPFGAEHEVFPNSILCRTLDRCNHFSSFPEHIDFTSHLKGELEIIDGFAERCRTDGWSPETHDDRMEQIEFAISPACCYHIYEGMEGWTLETDGRCVTAVLGCHRFEGRSMTTMSRLCAFTMREVVWVGRPDWVKKNREAGEKIMIQWAQDWGLACVFENANDMFFSGDFATKASFQRQQGAKRELRLAVPAEDTTIAAFSSNFHSVTFGKEFGITAGTRPAVTACNAWGLERWVYALFAQFGMDTERWPQPIGGELAQFIADHEGAS